jgi:ubiquinone/menaquinone biosynthesis C-methylase UbiE/acyl carrier protein
MNGSYQLDSFTKNRESEVKRLKAQVSLFFDKEFALYQKLGLSNGMKIIECGSGPGYLMRSILDKLPDCKATALEIDPYLFDVLTENSEQDGKKLYEPVQGSIYDTKLPSGVYDFVITRLVIEHLQEPQKALAEVRRILKPGGRFVIVSNDFAYHILTYPVIPELDEMYAAYCNLRKSENGNALVGRQLPAMLERAGFGNIDFEVICAHSSIKGDAAFLQAENVNISKSLVEKGFLKKESLASLVEKWFDMLKTPDHVLYRQLFVASGIKSEVLNSNHTHTETQQTKQTEVSDVESQREKFQKLLGKTSAKSTNTPSSSILESKENSVSFSPENIEDSILKVWRDTLANQQISNSDNYFDIGGDSVLIPEIVEKLSSSYNIKLSVMHVFEYPTVKLLTEFVKKSMSK